MIKMIKIPEELVSKVQKADIERSARRDIITYIIERNNIEITNERFLEYQKEYDEKFADFELFKSQIEKEYIQKTFPTDKIINWNLNYNTCEVTINIKE